MLILTMVIFAGNSNDAASESVRLVEIHCDGIGQLDIEEHSNVIHFRSPNGGFATYENSDTNWHNGKITDFSFSEFSSIIKGQMINNPTESKFKVSITSNDF